MEALVATKVLHWGNSYGLRISKHDVERLGLFPGSEVAVSLVTKDDKIDVPWFTFSGDGRPMEEWADELLYGRSPHGDDNEEAD